MGIHYIYIVPPCNPIEPPQARDGMIDITIMCTTSNHAVLRLCNPENCTALDCATIFSDSLLWMQVA